MTLYTDQLRRLADLIDAGTVPEPDSTSVHWHPGEGAPAVCTAVADDWTAMPDSSRGGGVVRAVLVPGTFDFSPAMTATVFVPADEPAPVSTAGDRFLSTLRVPV